MQTTIDNVKITLLKTGRVIFQIPNGMDNILYREWKTKNSVSINNWLTRQSL